MGFLLREELTLRLLVTGGISCDVTFYAIQTPPIVPSVLSNFVLCVVNAAILLVILWERTTIGMTAQQRSLYSHFGTMTPGQFRVMMRYASVFEASDDTVFLREGTPVDALYFIQSGGFVIYKGDTLGKAPAPSFIGEIAFLNGANASGTVRVETASSYGRWSSNTLQSALERRPRQRQAMVSRLAEDMAKKVAFSLPMAPLSVPEARQDSI